VLLQYIVYVFIHPRMRVPLENSLAGGDTLQISEHSLDRRKLESLDYCIVKDMIAGHCWNYTTT